MIRGRAAEDKRLKNHPRIRKNKKKNFYATVNYFFIKDRGDLHKKETLGHGFRASRTPRKRERDVILGKTQPSYDCVQ